LQSLRNADSVERGREAIESRLLALGRVHDLLLKTNWTSATLASIVQKRATSPAASGPAGTMPRDSFFREYHFTDRIVGTWSWAADVRV
jgi:hypothetical protein